jgi:transcriptional regulator with XRE-family HTH domain
MSMRMIMNDETQDLTFAVWLRNFREKKNIGLNQFASLTGLSNATISKIENSGNSPNSRTVKKIAARWHQNEDWLLELAGHRTATAKDDKTLDDPELLALIAPERIATLNARERSLLKDILRNLLINDHDR